MAPQLGNFVLETATAPGTGSFTLNGPETSRRSFSAAFPNGGSVFYFADDGSSAEWGVGTLTIGTPSTLSRTTIIGTTSGGTSALNFSGSVEVYNEIPAEYVPIFEADGHLIVKSISDWTKRQALGAADAEARYIGRAGGSKDYAPLQGGVQISTGNMWFSYKDSGGAIKYAFAQQAGDYATHTDVANVINNNIVIAGQMHVDTTGYLQIYRKSNVGTDGIVDLYSHWSSPNNNVARVDAQGNIYTLKSGSIYLDNPYANSGNNGDWNEAPGIQFGLSSRGSNARMWYEEHVGQIDQLTLLLNGYGHKTYFWFGPDGRLNSSAGLMALKSEIPTDIYSGTSFNNDFSTSDDRIINLPYGNILQCFRVDNVSSGRISFPQAFSSTPQSIVVQAITGGVIAHYHCVWEPDASGFTLNLYGSYDAIYVQAKGKR
ncbi:hypothetical protein [Acetobacter tropicalis]|uniref:Uncharacterized protein n=1 Tax=Acetobacter tropicalis TaxID=104102 RepID=A0A094YFN3_9PROT|nr:hypothetical protein [Acetobacter tropicalis]KAA8389645.1 hypothetical protein FOH22_06425 [Acetobacter tropicalis]KGB20820.1 hypothetical protein AtDm6_3470 [Acetobacter tropicalis]MDO8173265.1 hypothetical protein [Acetobacter tropicalis]